MTREAAISYLEPMAERAAFDSCKEALNMAIAALREQEERHWIPVTERLPERFGQYVLVTDGRCVSRGYILNYGSEQVSPWCVLSPIMPRSVTHWMPLPEPPKEDVP